MAMKPESISSKRAERRKNQNSARRMIGVPLAFAITAVVVRAIGDMIRAQGSSGFSKKTKLGRASLYRSFSGRMSPGFERVIEVLLALDVKLVAKPLTK
jgi:probable addiction module antidote protein